MKPKWWHMTVIPATEESEAGELHFLNHAGHFSEHLSQNKIKLLKGLEM